MSKYLPLSAALCAALITALTVAPALTTRMLVALLFALITGSLLTYSLLGKSRRAHPFPLVSNLKTTEGEDGAGDIATLGRLFEVTMSGMREGVLIIDREMRVVASNPAARNVFTHVQGKPDARYLTELTRNQAIRDAFVDALNGEERAEVRVEQPGAERRVYDLRVMPLGAGGGSRATGAIGVFFDITQLERLERVRQEFLSNVSHELRTPLTAILAFVETLEEGAIGDTENSLRFLSIIRRNAERMHGLINDILELSAIEAGNVEVVPARVPLRRLAEEVFVAIRGKADARGVVLRNEVPEDALVFADERRLEQMLTNLVDNAIKFNREGGAITLGQERGDHDLIYVTDTGEGIRAEHAGRLFERFYRVDKARSREMGGTGLGLAIVKHLARAHGGEVSVQSRYGEGSTFIIKLPLAPE